jgi:hypothetical protein
VIIVLTGTLLTAGYFIKKQAVLKPQLEAGKRKVFITSNGY